MAKTSAVVLCSGGLHSLVAAGLAAREHRVALLHVQDGRATAAQAAIAFEKQVSHFQPLKAWTVPSPALRQTALPVESAGIVHSTGSDAESLLLPFRELHLLTIAAGYARQLRADTLIWGVQFDQKQPDQMARTMEFVQTLSGLLDLSAPESPLTIKTPLMGLEDAQVIELGYQVGVPFAASWTCQMAGEAPCMSCSACARRTRAFRGAQLVDPLVVRAKSKVE